MPRHLIGAAFPAALLLPLAAPAQTHYLLDPQVQAAGLCDKRMVYDAARQQTLLVGTTGCNLTQAWTGTAWATIAPGPASNRVLSGLVYDSLRQVVVAVAGDSSTGVDTFEWDGTSWSTRDVGGVPPRAGYSVVYDEARSVTLLFGGDPPGSQHSSDLYAWDGVTWTLIQNGGPTPRSYAQMVYDSHRQTVLLFGGYGYMNGSVPIGDTWEWNGVYWYQHFGIAEPPPRFAAAFVFDDARGRAVLFDGVTLTPGLDTWEWDGTAWTPVAITLPDDTSPAAAYDARRDVVTLLMDDDSTTWEYFVATPTTGSYQSFGTGCAGPAGTPTLAGAPGTTPKIAGTLQLELAGLPLSPFNVPIGFLGYDAQTWNGLPLPLSLDPLGLTGCSAWIAPVSNKLLANTGGTATWEEFLPALPPAVGAHLYFQAAVLAPGFNPGGFVFTNAVDATIGTP